MKKKEEIDGINKRYVAQIVRRKMITKVKPSKKVYNRKKEKLAQEHATKVSAFLNEYNQLKDKHKLELDHKLLFTDKGISLEWIVKNKV